MYICRRPYHEGIEGSRFVSPFLTSAVDESERSNSRPNLFVTGKEPWYSLNVRLGAPHNSPESFGEEKCVLILPGFEPGTIKPLA
jgi:hypothetical protein